MAEESNKRRLRRDSPEEIRVKIDPSDYQAGERSCLPEKRLQGYNKKIEKIENKVSKRR